MSKIGGYGVYQSMYENTVNAKKTKETKQTGKQNVTEAQAAKAEKTDKENKVQLSKKAQELLEELKKTYGNMDFIVADYESDEEAAAYLARGTKEYSVLIEPETLEAMAADEETKSKYIGILNDAVGQLSDMKEQLGDKEDEVTHIGMSIDGDGNVTFFAELEKVSERQKEFVEKMRESKKAKKEELEEKQAEKMEDKTEENSTAAYKAFDKTKKARVEAGSVEELLEKIKAVDWEQIKQEEIPESGTKFDFSV